MPTLRLHIVHDGSESSLAFDQLPIRMGRDESNECRLEFAFVSRSHCRLELQEGRLVLRDEGSRQGTWVRQGQERLDPMTRHELSAYGNEFQIGALQFRAELCEDAATDVIRLAPERFNTATADLGGGAEQAVAFQRAPEANVYASSVVPASPTGPSEPALARALELYGQACAVLAELLRLTVAREPERAARLSETVRQVGAALGAFVGPAGGITIQGEPSVEGVALRQIQHLARQSVPQAQPITTANEITAFANRVGAVLATTLEGLASLRLAHRCETGAPSTEPSRALLAARLLDWTGDRSALDALRAELGEMLTHHTRIVDEVNDAWDALFALFDPAAMEKTCATARFSPFRYRALWNELVRRHAILRDRRTRAVGSTFDNVVRALRGDGSGSGRPAAADRPGILRFGILAA